MPAAPEECFKQRFFDESFPNNFKVADKLEAKDARNLSAISVATVVQIQVSTVFILMSVFSHRSL